MTTPNLPQAPDGSFVLGSQFGQDITESSAKALMKGAPIGSWTEAQGKHKTDVRDRIDLTYAVALEAQGSADQAVTDSSAAVNAALAAESTAASASERASYWEAEFVVASAAVVLGVNELLIGLCQNVPGGLTRTITDMHVALLEQPNGMTFELKKWDADGIVSSVLGTYTLPANATRANWGDLEFQMQSRERVYVNVTSVTGSVAPKAFQILLFGVME